jgi:hypothetical protein
MLAATCRLRSAYLRNLGVLLRRRQEVLAAALRVLVCVAGSLNMRASLILHAPTHVAFAGLKVGFMVRVSVRVRVVVHRTVWQSLFHAQR